MLKYLVFLLLAFFYIESVSTFEQCKFNDPINKIVKNFECASNKPYCCDNDTDEAHCCKNKHNVIMNMTFTIFGIFSVVFAAMLCAGCGSKKETAPGSPGEAVASQITGNEQAGAESPGESLKKSNMDLKSSTGSKIAKSKLDPGQSSMGDPASAISALDSRQSSAASSTIESKVSGMGSKVGSALDSRASAASSTGSSLDSKVSGTGSTVASNLGASNLGASQIDSRASQLNSKTGSSMGSKLESRASNAKSGIQSTLGSNLDAKGSNMSSKASATSKTN